MGEPLSPLNSPIGGLDDDFAITDRLLHDLQPDYDCQYLDNQWDTVTLPNSTDVGDSDLSQYLHNRMCTAGLQDIR